MTFKLTVDRFGKETQLPQLYATVAAFPAVGSDGVIYADVSKVPNSIYRWDAGTNTYVQIGGGGGVMLPAPKVQMYAPSVRPDVFVSDGNPSADTTVQANPMRYVKVTVPGVSQAVFDDISGYSPQIELMRYTRLKTRENASSGNGNKSGGFVHPSHGPAASGDGSFTHGGLHGGVGATVQKIRPTEWPIFASDDSIDVTQGILGFMCLVSVQYRESTGNVSSLGALVPSHNLSRGRGGAQSRFPYQKIMGGAYYAFRLSIKDKSDPRGKRIHGPLSQIIYCGNSVFPFLPDGLDPSGRAAAIPAPNTDKRAVNFWFDNRLPG